MLVVPKELRLICDVSLCVPLMNATPYAPSVVPSESEPVCRGTESDMSVTGFIS